MSTSINDKIKNLLIEDEDLLVGVVQSINSWNGSLEDLEYFENDEEFFNTFFEGKPLEAVRATNFGNYNYSDDYVRFNGYGNLDSCNMYKIIQDMKDDIDTIVELCIENYNNIEIDEITNLINEEDEEEVGEHSTINIIVI